MHEQKMGPSPRETILDSVLRAGARRGYAVFNADRGTLEPLLQDELCTLVGRARAALRFVGVGHHDRVVICMPTSKAWLATMFGAWSLGAAVSPVAPLTGSRAHQNWRARLAAMVESIRARVVVGTPAALEVFEGLSGAAGRLARLAIETRLGEGAPCDDVLSACGEWPSSCDLAHLQFTSGSTGTPRAVRITHAQLLANIEAVANAADVRNDDVFVSWLPLHHDMGFIGGLLMPLHRNLGAVLIPTEAFVRNPAIWPRLISERRASLSVTPPFALDVLARRVPEHRLEGVDLSSLRYLWIGAEPIDADVLARFRERFAGRGLRPEVLAPCYGMAEATLAITMTPVGKGPHALEVGRAALAQSGAVAIAAEEEDAVRIVGVGQAIADFQIQIRDEAGENVPDGTQGRILVRGMCMTEGYDGRGALADATGYVDTGDLGFLRDGELYITGRSKDLIIRAGQKIHPHWIEESIVRVAGRDVRRCAAFAARVSGREEVVVFLECAGMEDRDARALAETARCAAMEIAGVTVDVVEIVPPGSIPLTTSGKTQRAACRNYYEHRARIARTEVSA